MSDRNNGVRERPAPGDEEKREEPHTPRSVVCRKCRMAVDSDVAECPYCRAPVRARQGWPIGRVLTGVGIVCAVGSLLVLIGVTRSKGKSYRDFRAIDELCRRARQDFVEKHFAELESSVWKDQFIHCSFERGQPVIANFDTAVRVFQNLVEGFDEIAPHPTSTQFEIQGPVAVVRLPMASCRKGERTDLVDHLAIAVRQDGKWKIAATVLGNWKLTEADRFDPQNEDHQKLQADYDRSEQAVVDEEAERLRDLSHPLFRTIWPGTETDKLESALIGDRKGVVSFFQGLWPQSDIQKHRHKIVFAKVRGPLALTLAEFSQIIDNGTEEKGKCLHFFCRDGDHWKACLWMPGDWEKIFTTDLSSQKTSVAASPSSPKTSGPPDLQVARVEVKERWVRAIVGNAGGTAASGFDVVIFVDGRSKARRFRASVPPGEERFFIATGLQRGTHVYKVVVDPDDKVRESDETNNSKEARLSSPR